MRKKDTMGVGGSRVSGVRRGQLEQGNRRKQGAGDQGITRVARYGQYIDL